MSKKHRWISLGERIKIETLLNEDKALFNNLTQQIKIIDL